ncbi:MAG: hypothetical protein ACI9U2_003537 [Bradymonadia bacterium]|jgi:hypothetical protein
MFDSRAQYTLRVKDKWTVIYARVEATVSDHLHGVEIVSCADAIGRWEAAVSAGIEDAKWELHRRDLLPLEIEVSSFEGTDETTEAAARLATCVAIVRAAEASKSWPKVICEGGELQIVWGPDRKP